MRDDEKLSQLADDVHLVTAPVRWFVGFLKFMLFLIALPIVVIGGAIYSLITGKRVFTHDVSAPGCSGSRSPDR